MEALAQLLAVAVGVQGMLAAVFVYLYVRERDTHLAWWAAAWLLGTLVLGFWLLDHTIGIPDRLNAMTVLGAVLEQVLLVAGAFAFLNRRLPVAWLVAGLASAVATAIARAAGFPPGIAYVPASAFAIALTVTAGVTILRAETGSGRVIGWGIIVWGLHLMLYPLAAGQPSDIGAAVAVAAIMRLGIAAGILVVHFDRALATTAAREARLRVLFEGTSEGLFRVDHDGRFSSVNPALAAMLGYANAAEIKTQTIRDLVILPEELPWRAAAVPGGVEMTWRRSDGQPVLVMVHGHATFRPSGDLEHFDGFVCNVTEERRLRAQLEQSQRMEAIGRVTGGIAHDFNNLLTVILANTAMLEDNLNPDQHNHLLSQARDAAHRAAELTQHLLAFSRRQALEPSVVDLVHRTQAAVELTRPLIGETVAVNLQLPEEPLWVRADAIQLEQIVLNLALNARDAMPSGGELTVRTSRVTRSLDDLVQHTSASPGAYALLEVTDTGTGMAPDVLPHIFEPFFTTKEPGSGTGLGLSTVYGIVAQSHGYIEVDSARGAGTTFRVYLPELAAPTNPEATTSEAIEDGHGETVLVAEDEELLREVFQRILEQRGYRVLTARDGAEAIASAAHQHIDLLITDVSMPGMSGVELARRMRERDADLPVIFVSGYTERAGGPEALPNTAVFLGKPFSAERLLAKARAALDDRDPPG